MIFVLICGIMLVTQPSISIKVKIKNPTIILWVLFKLILAALSESADKIILSKLNSFHFSILKNNNGILLLFQTTFFLIINSSKETSFTISTPHVFLASRGRINTHPAYDGLFKVSRKLRIFGRSRMKWRKKSVFP